MKNKFHIGDYVEIVSLTRGNNFYINPEDIYHKQSDILQKNIPIFGIVYAVPRGEYNFYTIRVYLADSLKEFDQKNALYTASEFELKEI